MHWILAVIQTILLFSIFFNFAKLNPIFLNHKTKLPTNFYYENYYSNKQHKIRNHQHKLKTHNNDFIAKNEKNFFLKCPEPNDEQWKNKVNFKKKNF